MEEMFEVESQDETVFKEYGMNPIYIKQYYAEFPEATKVVHQNRPTNHVFDFYVKNCSKVELCTFDREGYTSKLNVGQMNALKREMEDREITEEDIKVVGLAPKVHYEPVESIYEDMFDVIIPTPEAETLQPLIVSEKDQQLMGMYINKNRELIKENHELKETNKKLRENLQGTTDRINELLLLSMELAKIFSDYEIKADLSEEALEALKTLEGLFR